MTTPQHLSDRYELGEILGFGGMSEVHLARDVRLHRDVAVKVLRADLARDPSFYLRFRREAQNAAALNHPAIVAVYDTGEAETPNGPLPYIVMEYVEGVTLRDIVHSDGPMEPQRAIEVIADACQALNFSHQHGIIHRDVKPANIMISKTGAVKVMDFGIARALADASSVTQTAAVIGTAQYLSPEQARGEKVDARSDVYSLGCLLYELVTGAPPFTGDSPVSVAYQHVREDPRLPSSINREIPPELDAILLKAMSKNPANRYQSAAEMRNDLLRALAGQRVEATPVMGDEEKTTILAAPPGGYGMGRYGGGYPGEEDEDRWEDEEDERARKRRRNWIIAGVVVALLLIGAAIAIALSLSSSSKPPAATQVTVPNLVGKTQQEATDQLQSAGLKAQVTTQPSTAEQKGQVISTNPTGGAKVDKGATVAVVVGAGPDTVTVPDNLVGLTEQQATQLIKAIPGFTGQVISKQVDSLQEPGKVTAVSPQSGQQIPKDSTVTLSISKGTITMPDVTRKTEDAARKQLTDAGVPAGDIQSVAAERSDVAAGTVVGTDPAPGATLKSGDTVTLQVASPVPPSSAPTTASTTTASSTTSSP